jgi:hypothetical protein
MMKKTKAYKGGRKISKTPKLITDPKILDKMSDKEIADMLAANFGLTGIGAKKTGGTVGRKQGKKVGTRIPDIKKAMRTPAKRMPYKKRIARKKPKSILENQMDILSPKQQTMKSGKRVGCGAAMRGYGKAMGKK